MGATFSDFKLQVKQDMPKASEEEKLKEAQKRYDNYTKSLYVNRQQKEKSGK